MPAIGVLTSILSVTDEKETIEICCKKLTALLNHNFPRVRRTTADQLLEAFLICDNTVEEHFPNFDNDKLTEILEETEWEAMNKAPELKRAKLSISEMWQ